MDLWTIFMFGSHPVGLLIGAALFVFQIWMLIDAVRHEEWIWVIFLLLFPFINAFLYYFLAYRQRGDGFSLRKFELPGARTRKRIRQLQAEIHHLDKAQAHLELGEIYEKKGDLTKALASYQAAAERDSEDLDIKAKLGGCLLKLRRPADAKPLLETVVRADPHHQYGLTRTLYAECLVALGDDEAAYAEYIELLKRHSYTRARLGMAELQHRRGDTAAAKALVEEILADEPHMPPFQRRNEQPWLAETRRFQRKLG